MAEVKEPVVVRRRKKQVFIVKDKKIASGQQEPTKEEVPEDKPEKTAKQKAKKEAIAKAKFEASVEKNKEKQAKLKEAESNRKINIEKRKQAEIRKATPPEVLAERKAKRFEIKKAYRQRRGKNAADRLREQWPDVFCDPPKPLGIGMLIRLQARERRRLKKKKIKDGSVKWISRGLTYWCSQPAYLEALAAGGHRYRFKGALDGEVTPEQQEQAKEKLRRIRTGKIEAEDKG